MVGIVRSAASLTLLGLIAYAGWRLHRLGYDHGVASMEAQVAKIQSESAKAVQDAKDKAKAQELRAQTALQEVEKYRSQVEKDLDQWLSDFQVNVAECAVAQKSLCPSLQDY